MIGRWLDQASEVLAGKGLEAWEVFLIEKRSAFVVVEKGQISRAHSSVDLGCGIRGLLGGSSAYASTTRLDGGGFSECADSLVELVRCSSPGGMLALPAPGPSENFSAHDPESAKMTADHRASLAKEAEDAALSASESSVTLHLCRCGSSHATNALRNSLGLERRFELSRVTLRLEGEHKSTGGTGETALWAFGYGPSSLDSGKLGREFSRLAATRLSAGPAAPGRTTLILAPRAAAQISRLCRILVGSLPAGLSPARPSPEAAGSAAFTLVDDGRLVGGYGSAPYDGEGTPTGRLALVEKGIRMRHAHTAATAAQAGSVSTGNALRPDFAFPPALGVHNLHVAPTSADPRETVKSLPSGLLLEEIWEAPRQDGGKGLIALEGWGFEVLRGELVRPVRDVRITERLGDLLLRLREVGPDLVTYPGGVGGSTYLFEDIPIGP